MTMTFQTESTLEMAEKTNVSVSLMNRVYYAARDGMAITLYALLSEQTPEQINCLINQTVLQDDGQRCTPLIVASRYGNHRVVKMLLDKFKPDLEAQGTVKFDEFFIEGASALWCAAGTGHLGLVKTLVKAGADVNHPTKTNSTPLRAACFSGRLDIVKYLAEHQANIHIANKYNNTCLMIAAYKGHHHVVSFLLENGADPNERAHCGATALHFASECNHYKVVIELLNHGTKMTKNICGMTPLMVAAERTRRHIVEYLVTREKVTKEEIIDAYELLGASYANDKDNYCLRLANLYLNKAMSLRYSDPNNIIRKKRSEPVPAYENWRECEDLTELLNIRLDPNSLHMESLVIRERILGTHNPEVPHPIVYRGAVFADAARFDRCIDLWLRALHLRQLNNISVVKDLLRFAQVFSQMIHVGIELQFTQVLNVLEASVTEIERNKTKIDNPEPKDDVDQSIVSKDEMESNITTTLYILAILTKLITLNERDKDKIDLRKAHYLVHKLCSLKATLRDGQTILHLAVNAETPVDDFHTNDVCKFPCASTALLLIQCGADVNAMDGERNTPLHVIVNYEKPISDFLTLHAIIMALIEAGAHMDTVNSQGKTPYDAATTGVAEIILRTQTKLSLKCMAAKVVKTYNLSYCGTVPQSLESFIELHGSGLNQG
ncbi:protein fem-1 homolog B-like isoform X1 [Leptopilina heterotoma]|uniref:protein fem-1 homolog B-like isoform X1 n=1 Tax=Leptopilina heterotoma TaxID=63436 RepID=UPI001CA9A7F1|nr:protein fem-1 homolog B-like isoform X1 [Leptopilina heterotoma]XP_043482022.1 protein fem-1 homolog B-like isoform X1 [Leptopilina heterotoma]XP_043482023.1 protein fem-1 homolog B-like isoform X1 [Leptopilina heterotoma]